MFVSMGELVRAVGMRGELKLLPEGDFCAPVLESPYLCHRRGNQAPQRIRVESARPRGATYVLKLVGVDDRGTAELMVGESLGFLAEDYDRPDFPRPQEPHPFLYHGLSVETVDGQVVGRVVGVMVLPANLVLRVHDGEGREHLIPVIPPVVRELDRATGRLVIEPMPGLLNDEES